MEFRKGNFAVLRAIFVPPQALTCSGSKGIISADTGTPKDKSPQR
jgi:hypothetical protein